MGVTGQPSMESILVLSFDEFFARLVRLTGWGIGVWAALAGKLDATQIIALVLAFVGFELVAKKRDEKLPKPKDRS